MRPVVVGADLPSRPLDRLPLRPPGTALGELVKPGLDERLRLAVAVAGTAVRDTAGGQVPAEVPEGSRPPSQRCGHDRRLFDASGRVGREPRSLRVSPP